MIRIAIVGPDASKWSLEKRKKAYRRIMTIFHKHAGLIIREDIDYSDIDFSNIVLVSGGCPKGGVDLWAESIATVLGIEMDIKEPEARQWEDTDEQEVREEWGAKNQRPLIGYKSRNILIAETCDVLYLVTPQKNMWSGAMWTYNYAQKLGKEVHEIEV